MRLSVPSVASTKRQCAGQQCVYHSRECENDASFCEAKASCTTRCFIPFCSFRFLLCYNVIMKRFIGRILLWRHWENIKITLSCLWIWIIFAFLFKEFFHWHLFWCWGAVPFALILFIVCVFGVLNLWDFLIAPIKRYIESAKKEAMR